MRQTLKLTVQEKTGKPINGDTIIRTVRSLKSVGLVYRIHSSTCYILYIYEFHCFAQIKHMVMIEGKCYLCLIMFFPFQFLEDAHAFEVKCHHYGLLWLLENFQIPINTEYTVRAIQDLPTQYFYAKSHEDV